MTNQLKKTLMIGCAVVSLGMFSSDAKAASSSPCTYSATYATYTCSGDSTTIKASTVATSTAVLKTSVQQSSQIVSSRVSAALGGNAGVKVASNGFAASTDGLAAGDGSSKLAAWVSAAWTSVEDSNTSTAFEGDVYTAMVGVDYHVSPKTVVGLALGYEDTDLDTAYNGFGGTDGNLEGDGYTIAPYVGGSLGHGLTGNLVVGYSAIDYDTVRYNQGNGNAITGSTDADRWFFDAAVSSDYMLNDNWRLRSKANVFYAIEEKDAFTETEAVSAVTTANAEEDNELGQFGLEGKFGYPQENFEPYALVGVSYDFVKDETAVAVGQTRSSLDDDDFAAKFGAGIDFDFGPALTGGLEAHTIEFRDDYDEYTVSGSLRMRF